MTADGNPSSVLDVLHTIDLSTEWYGQTAGYFWETHTKANRGKKVNGRYHLSDTSGLSKLNAAMTKKGDYSDNISFKFGNLDIALYNLE